MINGTPYEFADISSEAFREYSFPTAHGTSIVRIDNPTHLHVSKSGGHRILDDAGISHYIPSGWISLKWLAKPGKPNFVA